MQHRRDGLTLSAAVDDQDHRRTQQLGHLPGRSAGRQPEEFLDATVEKAHHPLHHGDVGTGGSVSVQRSDKFLADHHRVQIAPRPAGSQGVVAGVDEVRADLERRDPIAGPAQRPHETRCNGGLSTA